MEKNIKLFTIASRNTQQMVKLSVKMLSKKITNRDYCTKANSPMFSRVLEMLSEIDAEISDNLNPNKIIDWTNNLEERNNLILKAFLEKMTSEPRIIDLINHLRQGMLSKDLNIVQLRRNAFYRLNIKERAYFKRKSRR